MDTSYIIIAILAILIIALFLFFMWCKIRISKILRTTKKMLEQSEKASHDLTKKLKIALIEVKQKDEFMNSILDQIPFPIHVKDVENKYTCRYFNKKTREEFGDYPLLTAQNVLTEEFVKKIQEVDMHVYETGETYFAEEELQYRDGTRYRTLVQKSVIQFEGRRHILIVRWKTEGLLELQEKLREVNRQNRVILDNINAGLVYITPDFKVRWQNISKYNKSPLAKLYEVGKLCYESLYKRKSPCFDCLIQKAMDTRLVQKKELGSLEEGEVIELTAIPILDEKNNIEGSVLRIDDVTEQKRVYNQLEEAKLKAEQSDKLKSTFLANMSHEIRTPLNAIVGFSDIMRYAESEEEMEEYNRIISTNGELLIQLIDDILDLSKIEAGFIELNVSRFDLSNLFHELSITLQQRARNGVLVNAEVPEKHFFVELDRKRILQLVMNLASNAVKFTEKGNVTLGYEYLAGGNSFGNKSYLKIYVRDTGIGISEENQQKLFKRFEKFDTFAQGTGLGLSIVKSIALLMGGEVGVDSKLGEGSTFWVVIPYLLDDSDDNKELLPQNITQISEDLTPTSDKLLSDKDQLNLSSWEMVTDEKIDESIPHTKTVLLVEDNESNSFLVQSILKDHYKILRAHNGREAVELVKEQKVDLVLMDLKMPEMDGIEATQRIRLFNTKIPIIALTAYAFDSDRKKAAEAGCNSFLTKPTHSDELLAELSRFI